MALYRFISALVLRPWFATEVLTCPPLLERLTNPSLESGQPGAGWRHATVLALWSTVRAVMQGDAFIGDSSQEALGGPASSVTGAGAGAGSGGGSGEDTRDQAAVEGQHRAAWAAIVAAQRGAAEAAAAKLQEAVRAGPYGVGPAGADHTTHSVATVPR